jgi:hypothetical protein
MRTAVTSSLLLLVALVSTTQAAPPLTVSEYRAKAAGICRSFDNVPEPQGTYAQQVTTVLAVARNALARLRRLQPPASLAKLHLQVVAVISGGLDRFASRLADLKSGKLTRAQFVAAVDADHFDRYEDQLWKKLGVPACLN